MFPFFWRSLKAPETRFGPRVARSKGIWSRLRCEALEDRFAPALIMWDGGGGPGITGHDWHNAANWVGDIVPGPEDDAVIGHRFAGVAITASADARVHSVVSAATLQIKVGTFAIASTSTLNRLILSGGTFDADGNTNVANLTQRRGTLTGSGTFTISDTWTWSGGQMTGTGKTLLGDEGRQSGSGDVIGSSLKTLSRTLENWGTITYAGSGLVLDGGGPGGIVGNQVGAVFTVSAGAYFRYGGGDPGPLLGNAGTFNFIPGDPGIIVAAGITFTNSGTVKIGGGGGPGVVTFESGYTQVAGATILSDGTTLAAPTVVIDGGMLTHGGGGGGVTGIIGDVINNGEVAPGGGGGGMILGISGTYTQTAQGVLNIGLGGTDTGTFDQLAVSGAVTLDGALNVSLINGFHPSLGDSFPVLTSASIDGAFEVINGLDLGGGLALNPVYDANSLMLVTSATLASHGNSHLTADIGPPCGADIGARGRVVAISPPEHCDGVFVGGKGVGLFS